MRVAAKPRLINLLPANLLAFPLRVPFFQEGSYAFLKILAPEQNTVEIGLHGHTEHGAVKSAYDCNYASLLFIVDAKTINYTRRVNDSRRRLQHDFKVLQGIGNTRMHVPETGV